MNENLNKEIKNNEKPKEEETHEGGTFNHENLGNVAPENSDNEDPKTKRNPLFPQKDPREGR